jgi:hypothetical protein
MTTPASRISTPRLERADGRFDRQPDLATDDASVRRLE